MTAPTTAPTPEQRAYSIVQPLTVDCVRNRDALVTRIAAAIRQHSAPLEARIAELTAAADRGREWLPIRDDIKVDGKQVLGLVKWEWDTQPRRRIIVWNNGIGKAAYNWPCWMCAVTTTSLPDAIVLAYQPLPSIPEA